MIKIEYDKDYGIDKKTGWSVSMDGSIICQFKSFFVAMGILFKEYFFNK